MSVQRVRDNTAYRPQREKRRGKSGNYHRVHEEILKRANKDGVFQTTETMKAIREDLGLPHSSVSSTTFQWSDPTGLRGFRRVRLLSPRFSKSDPAEMVDSPAESPQVKVKPVGSFPPPIHPNKNGPFYMAVGQKPRGLSRSEQIVEQVILMAPKISDSRGRWPLRTMVEKLADLGFSAVSIYRAVKSEVIAGRIKRHGLTRWLVEQAPAPVRIDPLVTPNSFKGPKTQTMIDEERAVIKPEGIPTGEKAAALDGLITQLIQKKLEQPETLSLIDGFVKARMEEVIRRQLGL
jgi:hypothetical protein